MRPRCDHCAHWDGDPSDDRVGLCRRNPPVVLGKQVGLLAADEGYDHLGLWPETMAHDWCGEFKRKENV